MGTRVDGAVTTYAKRLNTLSRKRLPAQRFNDISPRHPHSGSVSILVDYTSETGEALQNRERAATGSRRQWRTSNDETSNSNAKDAKYSAKGAESLPLRSSAKTFAPSALKSSPSLP